MYRKILVKKKKDSVCVTCSNVKNIITFHDPNLAKFGRKPL